MVRLLSFAPPNLLFCLDNYNRKLSLSSSSSILSCFEKTQKLYRTQAFALTLWHKYSRLLNPLLGSHSPISPYTKLSFVERRGSLRNVYDNDTSLVFNLELIWARPVGARLGVCVLSLTQHHRSRHRPVVTFFWRFHSWKVVYWPKTKQKTFPVTLVLYTENKSQDICVLLWEESVWISKDQAWLGEVQGRGQEAKIWAGDTSAG